MDKNKTRLDSGTQAEDESAREKGKRKRPLNPAFEAQIIRTSEEAKAKGSKGGTNSAATKKENARIKRTAREAVLYLLELAAKGKIDDNLKEFGYPDEERTNLAALQARLFAMAMGGNLEAYMTLMKMAGYEPEENRKERESISADRRREIEVEAKVSALGSNPDSYNTALNMNDEDGNSDVVIYMPQIMSEDSCEMKEDEEEPDGRGTEESADEE